MTNVLMHIVAWLKRDSGQGLVEYAGIAGLVAIALATATAAGLLDGPIATLFGDIGECLDFDGSCPDA